MVLQAFIDESYEEDGTFVIGGYISTTEAWAKFSEEWKRELPNAVKGKSGNHRFKMREMAAFPDRLAKVGAFHEIIQRHAMMGVAFIIDKRDFDRALSRISVDNVSRILHEESLSIYFIGWRLFVGAFHQHRSEGLIPGVRREPIEFYFDDHTQKNVILDMWDDMIAQQPPDMVELYGAPPRFEDDEIYLPLQAADFRVWWIRKWVGELGPDNILAGEYRGFRPSDLKIDTYYLQMNEDQIADILFQWMQQSIVRQGLDPEVFVVRDNEGWRQQELDHAQEDGEKHPHWLSTLIRWWRRR